MNIIDFRIEILSNFFGIYIYTVCSLSCCKVNHHKSNPATHDSNGRVTAHEHQGQELQPLQSENDLVQDGAVDDQWDGNGQVQQGEAIGDEDPASLGDRCHLIKYVEEQHEPQDCVDRFDREFGGGKE